MKAPTARASDTTGAGRFFLRVLVLGSLLIFINDFWIIAVENRFVHTGALTVFSIFPTVLFTVFVLTLLNLALMRYAPRQSFTTSELGSLYTMMSVATALAGHDIIRQLVPLMGNAFWYATPENDWASLFQFLLPNWLTVRDRSVLQDYYQGGSTFWRPDVMRAWARPFLAWSVFTSIILVGMLSLNLILRKQWMDREKLNYPIAQLPIEVIGQSRSLFSNPLLWGGFSAAMLLELMAGLNYLYPAIPMFKLKYNFSSLFTEKPWNAMHGLPIYFYPFAVGFAFLMPIDLSFSFWFFYLLWKLQFVFVAQMGWPPGDAWHGPQRAGSWIALAVIALWTSRHHIMRVLRSVLFGRASPDDETDSMVRFGVYGLIGSGLFVLFFARIAGLQLWAGFLYFVLYALFSIAITRMRAELGPPTHELHNSRPDTLMVIFAGSRPIGSRNLTVMRLFSWLSYGYRCHPMPHQMEGLKIGQAFRSRTRRLVVAMILAGVLGAFVGIGLHIVLGYRYRYIYVMRGPFFQLESWLTIPRAPDTVNATRVLAGAAITVLLTLLKRRFLWWPLYPVGYAVSYGWAISWMWFSIFLGWLAKRVMLSSGGIGAYRRAIPFFLGLVIGQFTAGSLWCIVGLVMRHSVYSPFP